MSKVVIVGGLPNPIGGVTTFIKRYVEKNQEDIETIIDCYPSKNKNINVELKDKIIQLKSKFYLPWHFFRSSKVFTGKVVFFNFSKITSLLLLLFVCKNKKCQWHLMLHHGDIESSSWLANIFYTFVLNKFEVIYSLSPSQESIYLKYKVKSKVITTTSYVPAKVDFNSRCYETIYQEISHIRRNRSKIFISSGYPTDIYNHKSVINLASNELCDCYIYIFIYGPLKGRNELKGMIGGVENIRIIEDKSEEIFNIYLSLSDCYLRPTSKDSFGIAVADAINFGKSSIASNVCNRYQGCILYDHESDESLRDILLSYMKGRDMRKSNSEVKEFNLYVK